MTKPKKSCRPRHLYRGKPHEGGCAEEAWPHWHVVCRRCAFSWMQAALFDGRPYEAAVA